MDEQPTPLPNGKRKQQETQDTQRLVIVAVAILLVFIVVIGARLLFTSPIFVPPTATPTPFPTSTPTPTFTPLPPSATPCPTEWAYDISGYDPQGRVIIDAIMDTIGNDCVLGSIHEMLLEDYLAGTPAEFWYANSGSRRLLPRGATLTPSPTPSPSR